MFGRKKEGRDVQRRKPDGGLSKYGLLDIPTIGDTEFGVNEGDDGDDDAALEAELLALTSGSAPVRNRKKTPAPPTVNLDAMVSESLRDIPSDDDVSVDENDPSLLNELCDLVNDDDNVDDNDDATAAYSPNKNSPDVGRKSSENNMITLLQSRQRMYEEAEKNAKSNGEAMRARRFSRGIKTLKDMIQQASAGRVINEEDIPPPVMISAKAVPPPVPVSGSDDLPTIAMVPSRPAPPPPIKLQSDGVDKTAEENHSGAVEDSDAGTNPSISKGNESISITTDSPVDTSVMEILLARRNEYKSAALHAKKMGKTDEALQLVKVVKQFEPLIEAAREGLPVDLSSLPPPPQKSDNQTSSLLKNSMKEDSERQKSDSDSVKVQKTDPVIPAVSSGEEQGENPGADETLFSAPPVPTTILEALEQRLEKYRSCEEAAKTEGNSSKVRRMGRIVKQYESAIKLHKAGKPIPVDDLPTPPGFGPIPVEGAAMPATSLPKEQPSEPNLPEVNRPLPAEPIVVTPPRSQLEPIPATSESEESEEKGPSVKPNVRKSPQSRQEKQLALLVLRQKKFKDAAIEAKRKGEINQAKEYLRLAKGFDPLIEASQNGLPVDLASLPIPPENKVELDMGFDIVTLEDCIPGSDSEIYEKLEEDLLRQTKMCLTTRDHFKSTGDIASANRFEQLALHSKKDLDAVKCARRRGDPVPKFHYETRTFNIVQCCTELGDNDLELSVIQGTNYNVPNPKDVDTYVKYEFPYPTEAPVRDRTALIKDTNNPQYNQTFMLAIQRNVRACQRIFKRHSIKLEVWSRGGFFRGDTLIGTATVKLMPLETRCTIHDAFDLMDGRRAVGGKLEVKVRIRNPILTKQVEKVQEKWLVIDKYL